MTVQPGTILNDRAAIVDFGRYLGAEAGASLPAIEQFARDEGMSDHGFGDAPSLLAPLGNFVNGQASEWVGGAFSEMQRKLCQLGDLVIDAAQRYHDVEEDHRSLIVRNGLTGDDAETVTYGDGYGGSAWQPAPYSEYGTGGSSIFRLTDLELPPPDRPTSDLLDEVGLQMSSVGGVALTVLDLIWSEFADDLGLPGGDGQGFVDTMLQPLVGNPDSIRANGAAWKTVADNLGSVAGTMGRNTTELLTNSWDGPAADALRTFINQQWSEGAAWVGEQIGEFIAAGFDKIAEVCVKLASLAVKAITAIINKAVKLAARSTPIVGQIGAVVEYAADGVCSVLSWFGVDCDISTLHEDIFDIIDLAKQVFGIFDAIKDIVDTVQGYLDTARELWDFVRNIPDLESLTAVAVATANAPLGEHKNQLDTALAEAGSDLDEVDSTVDSVDPEEFEYPPEEVDQPTGPPPSPPPAGTTTTTVPEMGPPPAPPLTTDPSVTPPATPPTATTTTTSTTTTTVPRS